ncbi:hypothetical protein TELCIR_21842, partial [Teladorsagia circumcincta]
IMRVLCVIVLLAIVGAIFALPASLKEESFDGSTRVKRQFGMGGWGWGGSPWGWGGGGCCGIGGGWGGWGGMGGWFRR